MNKSWVRIPLIVICASGAIVVEDFNAYWKWAIPFLVLLSILGLIDEIVSRVNRAVQAAICRRDEQYDADVRRSFGGPEFHKHPQRTSR